MQVVAYVCVPSNYMPLLMRMKHLIQAETHLLDLKRDASVQDQAAS
jgi:hypothetical protein